LRYRDKDLLFRDDPVHDGILCDEGDNLHRLPQSRYLSTTSLMIGRKYPPSFASRLRTAKPVLPLEPALILGQEPVEMMEQHPVEDGPLRMSRAIDSRHIRNAYSINVPGPV
jgi:hypothetical protein